MLLSYCKQCRTAVIPFPSAEKVHLCAWNGFWQFILVSEMFASVQEINFRSIFWRKRRSFKDVLIWCFYVNANQNKFSYFDELTVSNVWTGTNWGQWHHTKWQWYYRMLPAVRKRCTRWWGKVDLEFVPVNHRPGKCQSTSPIKHVCKNDFL